MVRDQITLELWEELNRLYCLVKTDTARKVWKEIGWAITTQANQSEGLRASVPQNCPSWQRAHGAPVKTVDKSVTFRKNVAFHILAAVSPGVE